ncbi:MAG TPA: DinB family protein [Dyadobacter sp.]|jgi:hypothetical protein|nr:DinB family protein [Dyadobacter sp.]
MRKAEINPMPEFFDRYINLMDDVDLFDALAEFTPDHIFSDIDKLVKLGDKVYQPGKWTVSDILQHVIDNERIMAYRALRFSRNDKTILPGYDEELLAANTNASAIGLEQLMEEFRLVRASTIAMYRGMSNTMLLRSGLAYKSEISALALGFVILGHPVHHMRVIEERYFSLLADTF